MRLKRALPLPFYLLYGANALAGGVPDVVRLKDGRELSGVIESGATREIRIRVDDKSEVIPVDRIQSIQFDEPEPAPAPPRRAPEPSRSAEPENITLPAGTEIVIRTLDRIDSRRADLYKEYAASLDEGLSVNGIPIVPARSNANTRHLMILMAEQMSMVAERL